MSIALSKLLKDFQDIHMVWEAEKNSWEYENEKMYASGVSDGFKHAAVALHSILRKDTEQKKIIIKACVEIYKEHRRLHAMRRMCLALDDTDHARRYVHEAMGLDKAAHILMQTAGIGFMDIVTADADHETTRGVFE
ncbi:hypothetical protein NLX71_12870 [Paenibacillus sp. MZ04-78.2]|uniref:hypothetical protein n=1 Tax=Paenibacillus sp. MZ04-78.2 TaxID=2962034 RepID=UPI0020B6A215|nr:hypothetical protein [Paenibacillus sp. MZ04-78.2]MCP3774196.1 hypothetical protein [Paenibacillus sp. MZ04-78.2]